PPSTTAGRWKGHTERESRCHRRVARGRSPALQQVRCACADAARKLLSCGARPISVLAGGRVRRPREVQCSHRARARGVAAMSESMLRLDGLVRHFDGVHAVDDVSFSVERGEVLGFIGPNGAGKTTTMRILATLDSPQRGDAFIGGYSVVTQPREVRRITGFMPDYAGVYALTTVEEYLDFFARSYGLRGAARRTAVTNIIEFMGIGDLRDRYVESLSKGLKQLR